jgi:ABC-type transporter Mla subunit MlaD
MYTDTAGKEAAMLKTFRRMFSSKTPLEFEVTRHRPEDDLSPREAHHTDVIPSDALDALERVSLVATRQAAAQTRIEGRLEELTPLARQAVQRLDAIGSGERDIAGLIETLKSELSDRERALGGSIEQQRTTNDRSRELLDSMHDQNTRLAGQQKRLTTATITTCVIAGLTLITAVFIVLQAG